MAALCDCDVEPLKGLNAACAVELVHTASLILDDLPSMDNATMRRGRATLHRIHGESVAILTAIALLNSAYGLCSAPPHSGLVDVLVKAVGPRGLVGGQLRDLHPKPATSLADIEVTYAEKTGSLFVAACEIAATLAGADALTSQRLRRFAEFAGLAFQLADDALDAKSNANEVGKNVLQDTNVITVAKATSQLHASTRRLAARSEAAANLAFVAPDGMINMWLSSAVP